MYFHGFFSKKKLIFLLEKNLSCGWFDILIMIAQIRRRAGRGVILWDESNYGIP